MRRAGEVLVENYRVVCAKRHGAHAQCAFEGDVRFAPAGDFPFHVRRHAIHPFDGKERMSREIERHWGIVFPRLSGVFGIFQGGCRSKIYDDCDKNHYKIVGTQGVYENIREEVIISIGYLFGFDVNLDNETVLFAGWVHIFLGALLCFDAYVQNIEDHFNKLSKLNKLTKYNNFYFSINSSPCSSFFFFSSSSNFLFLKIASAAKNGTAINCKLIILIIANEGYFSLYLSLIIP